MESMPMQDKITAVLCGVISLRVQHRLYRDGHFEAKLSAAFSCVQV